MKSSNKAGNIAEMVISSISYFIASGTYLICHITKLFNEIGCMPDLRRVNLFKLRNLG